MRVGTAQDLGVEQAGEVARVREVVGVEGDASRLVAAVYLGPILAEEGSLDARREGRPHGDPAFAASRARSAVFSAGAEDGLGYSRVAAAAADVAGEGFLDLGHGGTGILVEERAGGHHEAGGAEAALQRRAVARLALSGEGLDDGVVVGQAFDGEDIVSLGFYREEHAGEHGLAVPEDRAGPAGALVAGYLEPGEAQLLA